MLKCPGKRSLQVKGVVNRPVATLRSGACLTVKVLSGLPLRQATGFVESLLALTGPGGPCQTSAPYAGDKAEGEGGWNARRHSGPERRIWRKIHIGTDEETLEVRAIEVTTSNVGDAPVLPELPGQIPIDQAIGSVTADGACDTRKCHDAIAARNAGAVIPPRRNAKLRKADTSGAGARNEAVSRPGCIV